MSSDIFNNIKPYFQDTCSLGLALFVCFAIYYYNKYDNSFYIKWIESDEGHTIANRGKEYVRDKFGKEYIKKLADFFASIS